MAWIGWLGWIPRSGLPSHIHTQNVCGTVNHFFKYRMITRTAVRRLMSARVPQDTSSGLALRRSRSRSLLSKSCLDTHVTEVMVITDPRKHYGHPPQRWQEFPRQSLAEEEAGYVISLHAAKKTCHMETISSSVMGSPDDESSGVSPKTASSPGASGMDLILRVSGPCYIRHR